MIEAVFMSIFTPSVTEREWGNRRSRRRGWGRRFYFWGRCGLPRCTQRTALGSRRLPDYFRLACAVGLQELSHCAWRLGESNVPSTVRGQLRLKTKDRERRRGVNMCEFNSFTKACTLFLVWAATAIALPAHLAGVA
jgi:hypothetical protein